MRWARTGDKTAYSVLVATSEGKRLSERPRYRLEKYTKMILKKWAGHDGFIWSRTETTGEFM